MGVRGTKGRSRGDLGKIHRSKEFGVQGCRRKYGKGDEGRCREHSVGIRARGRTGKERGEDGTRMIEWRSPWESSEERQGWLRSEEKRKCNTSPFFFVQKKDGGL